MVYFPKVTSIAASWTQRSGRAWLLGKCSLLPCRPVVESRGDH